MGAVEPFFVVGGYSGAEGPGFCTPVFQSRTSNYLAIQRIAKNDRIVGFLSIEDEGLSRAEYINQGLSRRPGLKAYYAFRKSDGSLRIDTRGRLRRTLVSEYEKLRDRPFLRRTIARFVGDKDLYQSADRDVKRLIEKGFVHHSTNARMLGDGDIERLFVERQEYRLLVENLQRGLNTIVFGRRGSGKTHLLRRALSDLTDLNYDTHWGDFRNAEYGLQQLKSFLVEVAGRGGKVKQPAICFIDDLDVVVSNDDDVWGFLRAYLPDVCFAASASSMSMPKHDYAPQIGHDFQAIEMAPLSANEVAELFQRASLREGLWEDDLSLFQAEKLLEGFTFREVLLIVSALAQGEGGVEARVRRSVGALMERALEMVFSSMVENSRLQVKRCVLSILDAIAASKNQSMTLDEIAKLAAPQALRSNNEVGDIFYKAIDRLLTCGVIVESDARSFRFAHRMIRDGWLDKRRTNLAAEQLDMHFNAD